MKSISGKKLAQILERKGWRSLLPIKKGSIKVKSELGKGSIFTVCLPIIN